MKLPWRKPKRTPSSAAKQRKMERERSAEPAKWWRKRKRLVEKNRERYAFLKRKYGKQAHASPLRAYARKRKAVVLLARQRLPRIFARAETERFKALDRIDRAIRERGEGTKTEKKEEEIRRLESRREHLSKKNVGAREAREFIDSIIEMLGKQRENGSLPAEEFHKISAELEELLEERLHAHSTDHGRGWKGRLKK